MRQTIIHNVDELANIIVYKELDREEIFVEFVELSTHAHIQVSLSADECADLAHKLLGLLNSASVKWPTKKEGEPH